MKSIFNKLWSRTSGVYEANKRYVPLLSFVAGFSYDSATLRRIDQLGDNITLLAYLILLACMISIVNLVDSAIIKKEIFTRYQSWYPVAIQFFLGGLFSAYVIFYFQSASVTKSWLFMGILVLLLIANEFLENRLKNLYLQTVLLFLASFAFFTFFLPVVTKLMNVWIFLLGGILSLALVAGILFFLYRLTALQSLDKIKKAGIIVAVIYLSLNMFYMLNLIPPVPLSMKYGGIFHQVKKVENQYRLRFESPQWWDFFRESDNLFHYAPNDTVFCFSAIFAPTELQKGIYHHWQQYSPQKEAWITTDKLKFTITGGREDGYRGYTFKKNIGEGDWRVEVKTDEELLIRRINFDIVKVDSLDKPLREIWR